MQRGVQKSHGSQGSGDGSGSNAEDKESAKDEEGGGDDEDDDDEAESGINMLDMGTTKDKISALKERRNRIKINVLLSAAYMGDIEKVAPASQPHTHASSLGFPGPDRALGASGGCLKTAGCEPGDQVMSLHPPSPGSARYLRSARNLPFNLSRSCPQHPRREGQGLRLQVADTPLSRAGCRKRGVSYLQTQPRTRHHQNPASCGVTRPS